MTPARTLIDHAFSQSSGQRTQSDTLKQFAAAAAPSAKYLVDLR